MGIEFALLIVLIFLSGAFSASEIALTALGEAKVRAFEKDGKFASMAIVSLKKQPQKLLITILVGNQVANVLATVTATLWIVKTFGEGNISLATVVFTFTLIIFGSISPKTVALRFPEAIARGMAYPLLGFLVIFRPVSIIFEWIARGTLKLLKSDRKEFMAMTAREIEAILDIGAEKGVIAEEEEVFMKQILKFGKTKVEEIMTLLKDIDAIDIKMKREELAAFFKAHDHTFFPVYEESLNNIRGIISVHSLVRLLYRARQKEPLRNFKFRSAVVVPKTATLTELFRVLKEKHRRMIVVIDEHGQTIGLVTLNDILEEIMGTKIQVPNKTPEAKIEKKGKNCWEADGEVPVAKINEQMGLSLDFPEHNVISLVVLEKLRRFPEIGEKVQIDGAEIEIKRVEKNVIKKVVIRKKKEAPEKKPDAQKPKPAARPEK
ncbi:HlyC/CorC family transporter [Candidatus Peregrinibacteria bacterium]|nr:HlyC/CorC family transporter [Candidatus Peregrinibacteria bacterium]